MKSGGIHAGVFSTSSTSGASSGPWPWDWPTGSFPGPCTFGFIAPILAIVTVQEKVVTGVLFILLFAIGHCLPIVVAGSSTAAVKHVLENNRWQGAGVWFRRGAGAMIALLGAYFISSPFISAA